MGASSCELGEFDVEWSLNKLRPEDFLGFWRKFGR
jgi:hypothetical protein